MQPPKIQLSEFPNSSTEADRGLGIPRDMLQFDFERVSENVTSCTQSTLQFSIRLSLLPMTNSRKADNNQI